MENNKKKTLFILTLAFIMIFVTGCNKKVLTIGTYTSIMKDFGYTNDVIDLKQFSDESIEDDPHYATTKDIDTIINSTKEGSKTRCSINIYDNAEHAIFGTSVKPYNDDVSDMTLEKCTSKDNYDKCVRVIGSDYIVHVRVANTFLYCVSDSTERDNLDKIVKKLGY